MSIVDGAPAAADPSTVEGPRTLGWVGAAEAPAAAELPPTELGPAVPAQDGDWLRPPAYLLVNGLPAAQLVLLRRLRPPGAPADVVSWTTEVLVPLTGSGYLAVITGTTTDRDREDEAEWTTLAVAGTLTYRPASSPTPAPPPREAPIPELRFASTAQLLASYAEPSPAGSPALDASSDAGVVPAPGPAPAQNSAVAAPPPRGSLGIGTLGAATLRAGPAGSAPAGSPPVPRGGTIGQAAVDQLSRLVAGHPSAPRDSTAG
jgi:hypothetical protein